MMKIVFALAVGLLVSGVAHAQQYKALPVESYVLVDPDGTPRYLVQYTAASNVKRVYQVKAVTSDTSNQRPRRESQRRTAPKKRFIWPNEIM
jgi:hypothetical protein